jgi:hypothetical protein
LDCDWRYADVAAIAPQRDASANLVDKPVFFDTVLGPFGVEDLLLLPFFFLARGMGTK